MIRLCLYRFGGLSVKWYVMDFMKQLASREYIRNLMFYHLWFSCIEIDDQT